MKWLALFGHEGKKSILTRSTAKVKETLKVIF
jgi:hypothetical protein